jgi:hypothetical protein
MATAQHSRPRSFGRSRVLPLDRIVVQRALEGVRVRCNPAGQSLQENFSATVARS